MLTKSFRKLRDVNTHSENQQRTGRWTQTNCLCSEKMFYPQHCVNINNHLYLSSMGQPTGKTPPAGTSVGDTGGRPAGDRWWTPEAPAAKVPLLLLLMLLMVLLLLPPRLERKCRGACA